MTEPITPDLIAPCGIDCRLCLAYGRPKNACPGCRGDDTQKMKSCLACRIKNCEALISGQYTYCYECGKFPCERIKHLDKRYRTKYATQVIENLNRIKENGIDLFVAEETARWTCPACGAILCMHRPNCRECGFLWHKE